MALGSVLSILLVFLGLVIAFAGAWLYHVSIMAAGFIWGALLIFPMFAQTNIMIAAIAALIGGIITGVLALYLFFLSIYYSGFLIGAGITAVLLGMGPLDAVISVIIATASLTMSFGMVVLILIFVLAWLLALARILGNESYMEKLNIIILKLQREAFDQERLDELGFSSKSHAAFVFLIFTGVFMFWSWADFSYILYDIISFSFKAFFKYIGGIAIIFAGVACGKLAMMLHKVMVSIVTGFVGATIVAIGLTGQVSSLSGSASIILAIGILGTVSQLLGRIYFFPAPDLTEEEEEDNEETGEESERTDKSVWEALKDVFSQDLATEEPRKDETDEELEDKAPEDSPVERESDKEISRGWSPSSKFTFAAFAVFGVLAGISSLVRPYFGIYASGLSSIIPIAFLFTAGYLNWKNGRKYGGGLLMVSLLAVVILAFANALIIGEWRVIEHISHLLFLQEFLPGTPGILVVVGMIIFVLIYTLRERELPELDLEEDN